MKHSPPRLLTACLAAAVSLAMHASSTASETKLTLIPSGPGPEDIALIDWQGQPAIITASVSRPPSIFKNAGGLEVFVIGQGDRFLPLVSGCPQGFNPAGVSSVLRSSAPGWEGKQLVYVTNQSPQGHRGMGAVEVFEVVGRSISHLATLGPSPLLLQLNGIVAAKDGTVYATRFKLLPGTDGAPRVVKSGSADAEKTHLNSIVCFTPATNSKHAGNGTLHVVARGINGANGLALTEDGRTLFCASYHSKEVLLFEREPKGGKLAPPRVVLKDLAFHPDNLKGLTGGLFTATGQKSPLATLFHFLTFGLTPSKGAAVTFSLKDGKAVIEHDWTRQMKHDGRAPSTVLPHNDQAFIAHIRRSGIGRIASK